MSILSLNGEAGGARSRAGFNSFQGYAKGRKESFDKVLLQEFDSR